MFCLCGSIFKPKVPKFKPPAESTQVHLEGEVREESREVEGNEE